MKRFIFVKAPPLPPEIPKGLWWRARPSTGLCDRSGEIFEEVAFEWLPKPEDSGTGTGQGKGPTERRGEHGWL